MGLELKCSGKERMVIAMDVNETVNNSKEQQRSYGQILNELGLSFRDLVHSDVQLLLNEAKLAKESLSRQARNSAIYIVLLFLSVFPMLAFAVIGLGNFLDQQYWLSALIVGILLSAIGGIGLYTAVSRIRNIDLNFGRTKTAIEREKLAFKQGVEKVQRAVKGELHASQ